jgi:hypothetical protein
MMSAYDIFHDLVVPLHGCSRLLRMLLPKDGASLDVGE